MQVPTTEMRATMPISPIPFPHERQLVFTSSQAARYLGVSLATIRRWADAGHLACYRTPGGQRRFSREQLDNFTLTAPARRRRAFSRSQRGEAPASLELASQTTELLAQPPVEGGLR